ncbi:MAG: PH domain-containing protein [Dehalococcoidia bacterium]|nr:PH domain-containing protein [Dehalococcoidia bacterium]
MTYVEKLLSEDEEIIHVGRQHWLVMVRSLVGAALLAAIVIGASVAIYILTVGTGLVFSLAVLVLLLVPLGKAAVDWLKWRSRSLVVTNRRVIHVSGVFNKNVLDSSLDKVNDVSLKQSIWGRMFDFGDLEILTASEFGVNRFDRIAHPVKCKTVMLDQKTAGNWEETPAGVADIPAQISKLAKLREKGIISDSEFEVKKADLLRRM